MMGARIGAHGLIDEIVNRTPDLISHLFKDYIEVIADINLPW